jgi:hypothetical protein
MSDETPLSKAEIEKTAYEYGIHKCEDLCHSNFIINSNWHRYSWKTDKIAHKYMIMDEHEYPKAVNWKALHGKKKKLFKFAMKIAKKRVLKTFNAYNKYCGQKNILYIHARIGGGNWEYFGGAEIAKQPWFIEKVDDWFDCTYCDIYAKIRDAEHE